MKQNLLLFCLGGILATGVHAQSDNTSATYADSLQGFDRSQVQLHCGVIHDSAEVAAEYASAERRYIDYKYKLGIYSPDYQYPGKYSGNAVFPVSSCSNVDFETGDFTGWSGTIGDNMTSNTNPFSNIQTGFFSTVNDAPISDASARHTICTTAGGTDPYGGFPVVSPTGGNFSVRLGGQTPNYQGETIEQTFTVSPSSTSFAYQYAVVLNDPQSGHAFNAKPYFRIEVLDPTGQPINSCTQLFVVADTSSSSLAGFQLSSLAPPTGGVAYYKPWTLVNFDLSGYVNQNITVRFTVAGCTQSGHFGYAYVDCSCSSLAASINFCPGNTFLYLSAPAGYGYYQWLDPNHQAIPGATNDTLIVNNPTVGDTFYVYLTSQIDTSCHNTLPVVLEYTHIFPNAVSTDETCYQYDDGTLAAVGTAGIPPYTYTWSTSPPATTQNVTNVPPGVYTVHMVDSLGCEDFDTVTVLAAPRLDTSLFAYDYCYGDAHVVITAPGGFLNYQWFGPNGDSLPTPSPSNVLYVNNPTLGDPYTVVMYSASGCPLWDTMNLNFQPPPTYFAPDTMVNIFTPNNDGINDYFYPYYDYSVANQTAAGAQPAYDFFALYISYYEIWVYDRWGKEVFYSNDYKYGWDGMVNKDPATEGVYYYVCRFASSCDANAALTTQTGYVHLKR